MYLFITTINTTMSKGTLQCYLFRKKLLWAVFSSLTYRQENFITITECAKFTKRNKYSPAFL